MEFARLASFGFAVIMMAVASEAIAVEAIGRIRLPGSSAQAQPPVGWSCFMDTMTVYEKKIPRLVCRSTDHRMAATLHKMTDRERPASLREYFESHMASYKPDSKWTYRKPSYVNVAGRQAVETMEIIPGNEIKMSSPVEIRSIETFFDSIVLEGRDGFYQCSFDTESKHYTDEWHNYLHTFCDSIQFDAN